VSTGAKIKNRKGVFVDSKTYWIASMGNIIEMIDS